MNQLNSQSANFYFDGCALIQIKQTQSFLALVEDLRQLHFIDLGEHEDFSLNYKDTYDLKRDADLNEKLVKFLFDQGIPHKIKALTGRNYILGDLVLRKSRQIKSYMPWHRDTYLDKNKNLVGRTPPLIKLIFYPRLEDSCSHELSILRGSSKRVFRSYVIDKLQRFFVKKTKIFQSNETCVLFDSAIIHSAIPSTKHSNGSFRLIYNFCDESQVDTFRCGKTITDIYKKYELSN